MLLLSDSSGGTASSNLFYEAFEITSFVTAILQKARAEIKALL